MSWNLLIHSVTREPDSSMTAFLNCGAEMTHQSLLPKPSCAYDHTRSPPGRDRQLIGPGSSIFYSFNSHYSPRGRRSWSPGLWAASKVLLVVPVSGLTNLVRLLSRS
jgi:hypothetical protein